MNTTNNTLRSLLVIASLAGATLLAGCNAASLTGPEPSDVQATGGTGGTGTGTGGNGGDSHGENEPRNL
jgi:predicted small secreted protein